MAKLLHKTMKLKTIMDSFPDATQVLLEKGLKVGCSANLEQTLEEGAKALGFEDATINQLMYTVNEAFAASEHSQLKQPEAKDFKLEVVQEGPKNYYCIAGLKFSENSYKAIHDLSSKNGLQLRIDAGGCSGYTYKYDYVDGPAADEKTFPFSDKLKLYLNDFTFDKLNGSIVNYQSGLKGSGLEFVNPNAKKACSCGISFGF